MIQCQLKLRLTGAQRRKQLAWLPILGSVYNFGVRKIELNARDGIHFSAFDFQNLLAGHGERLGIPSHTIQGILGTAYNSWQRCFKGLSRKPRLKGVRRPLNSIPFPDAINPPIDGKIQLPGLGKVRFHKQELPKGKIKNARLVKRASGNYLCLFIDAAVTISRTGEASVGVDPGFRDLVTLSTGERVTHPQELRIGAKRFGQAQRGHNKKLSARLQERIKNRRKDRNHKLSHRLVAENRTICFLQDNHRAMAKRFGKSVGDSAHGGLRAMLLYKSLAGGTNLIFPGNRNSTRICSTCGALSGPTGLAGLKVREWDCGACGAHHERDVNAARNALIAGLGWSHETVRAQGATSEIPTGSITTAPRGERMKRERFEAEAAKMKIKNDIPPIEKTAIEKEEAFRLGYTAGTSGKVASRDDCPLRDPILRRRWREGFDLGAGKGLKVALPKMAR